MRTVTLNHPFRESGAIFDPNIAQSIYHVALAGRGYYIDTEHPRFLMESIEAMRQQQDSGEQAGEGSLSNLDLWTRASRSWHEGAGQTRGDEEASSPDRFASSKGVNVWERWELTLLHEAALAVASAPLIATVLVAGGRVFYQAGQQFFVSDDGVTFDFLTTVSGAVTTQPVTDGTTIYFTTASGLRKLSTVGVESAGFTLAGIDVIGVSKGRVWAGVGDTLYWWVPANGTATSASVIAWPTWTFTAIADGLRATYASGYTGDQSAIYRVPLSADGASLEAATLAWQAPDGEIVHSMVSYLGFLVIGTSAGVRFALVDNTGDLTAGSFIETPEPVTALEPQDRFVWFGWSDYDDESTGLGRLDLSVFTSSLTPAYASDLMFLGQGPVTSVATFEGRTMFTVAGAGLVIEQDQVVGSGTLTTSDWTYDLDDDKTATLIGVKHRPLDGLVSTRLLVDGFGSGVTSESSKQGSSNPPLAHIDPIRGHRFAITVTMEPLVADGPVLTGIKLMARPNPPRGVRIMLPILLAEQHDLEGSYLPGDPFLELAYLRKVWKTGAAVTLQWGAESLSVFPANFQWVPYRPMLDKTGWSGTCIMELREVTQ